MTCNNRGLTITHCPDRFLIFLSDGALMVNEFVNADKSDVSKKTSGWYITPISRALFDTPDEGEEGEEKERVTKRIEQ